MSRKQVDREEFIKRANGFHNSFYDYSKVHDFKKLIEKVTIICPKHGEFLQKAEMHIQKDRPAGCPQCGREKQKTKLAMTTEQFIERSKDIYSDRFDYSKTSYVNGNTYVTIICPKHGEFSQRPDGHLEGHVGCKECQKEEQSARQTFTTEDFIRKAKKKHGDKYDYSKTIYIRADEKVTIICPIHGEFQQEAIGHLQWGCIKCGRDATREKVSLTTEEFIKKAKAHLRHCNKYDYSRANYINGWTEVEIICPYHGSFFQRPDSHLEGHGCPRCFESNGELKISLWLDKQGIFYQREKRFSDCRNKMPLPFDFYLSERNILIEYDGEQHFTHEIYGLEDFEGLTRNDQIKTKYAEDKGIRLLRISYVDFDRIEEILSKELRSN